MTIERQLGEIIQELKIMNKTLQNLKNEINRPVQVVGPISVKPHVENDDFSSMPGRYR